MTPKGLTHGRPPLGHVGHRRPLKGCEPCLLREWRLRRGLNQAAAARLLRASVRALQRWERGGAPVPGLVLQYIVLLDVTRSSLRGAGPNASEVP